MLSSEAIAELAGRLYDAERTREPVDIFSLAHPGMTVDDSYAVQRAWMARKLIDGKRVVGHKIGLTSVTMQRAVGIDEPDYGVLLDDMIIPNGETIAHGRFREPRVEVELAFMLTAPIEQGASIADILNATLHIRPSIEIIDARMHRVDPASGNPRTIIDTIADNAAGGGVVLGDCFIASDTDLPWIGATLARNGTIEVTGLAAGVLGSPAMAVAWLANRLARHGDRLEAGEFILSGSFTRPIDANSGDVFVADFGQFGTVSCRFG